MKERNLKSTNGTNGNDPDDTFIILDRDFDEDPYGHLRGESGTSTDTLPKPQPL